MRTKERQREESGIVLKTVDLNRFIDDNTLDWKQGNDFDGFNIHGKLAFVEVEDEIFCIDDEGVGSDAAITETEPLMIDVYGFNYIDNGERRSIIPIGTVNFTPADFKKYAWEEISLEDFIRTFGRRLEINYNISLQFFRSKGL